MSPTWQASSHMKVSALLGDSRPKWLSQEMCGGVGGGSGEEKFGSMCLGGCSLCTGGP